MLFDAAIFGLIVADVIGTPVDLGDPPRAGGLKLIDSLTLTTGGNVCNVALAMAKLGMRVAAAGLVGRDVLGRAVVDRLKDGGVNVSAVLTTSKAQTSATMVAVEKGGERCFFHTAGATPLLDARAFARCAGVLKRAAYVQVGYFGLLPGLTRALPATLRQFRKIAPRTRIALDTVNPPASWQLLKPILPHLDVFAPSRTEAAELTGQKSPPRMVAAFRRYMKEGLIGIKLDAQGCYLDDGRSAVTVPAYRIKVVDTTGAGDSWFGGLLTGLRLGMSLEDTARLANRTAADCCTALGASAGVRSLRQTLARM